MMKCDCCHQINDLAPIFCDETWQKLAEKRETLCCKCCFDRAEERQVDLTFGELVPCAFNLSGHPQSWFDLFLSAEELDPFNHGISKGWLDALVLVSLIETARKITEAPSINPSQNNP
jgi:hypothetical protein